MKFRNHENIFATDYLGRAPFLKTPQEGSFYSDKAVNNFFPRNMATDGNVRSRLSTVDNAEQVKCASDSPHFSITSLISLVQISLISI